MSLREIFDCEILGQNKWNSASETSPSLALDHKPARPTQTQDKKTKISSIVTLIDGAWQFMCETCHPPDQIEPIVFQSAARNNGFSPLRDGPLFIVMIIQSS
ncbi:hypothetical protein Y032_0024g1075 [Ancylostoma ceylanicum]|uniref:Uncharacterized protein n=1 Tax=Ancylostoma ceylanicum TaxID=53326 RepID=A0A016UWP7_9BILA|nr:hypothetical protein Y032_0024g1075 [Ancylostoma ceylanicum]